jgi:putative ABC transport system substrate-binding protein
MKKISMGISLFLNIVLVIVAVICYKGRSGQCAPTTSKKGPSFNIALLAPAVHPSMDQIEKGFVDTLSKSNQANYTFTHFNANGDRRLLSTMAENIVQGNYDLIFTIGAMSSQLIKEQSSKKKKSTPHVFSAVADPIRLGMVQSLEQPGGFSTGIVEDYDINQEVTLLCAVKPGIKTVLLVYDPTQSSGGLQYKKDALEKALAARGIKLITAEVFHQSDIVPKTRAFISQVDVVIIFKDHTVVAAVDSLIKLCNLHHITLMTSELDSNAKGAALSFGVEEYNFGSRGAAMALQILEQGHKPGAMPCMDAGDHMLKINTKAMAGQGLVIPQDQLFLYRSIRVN